MCLFVVMPPTERFDLTMIMARKAKPIRTLSTWMSSMERGRLVSTVVLKPGITPLMFAPGRGRGGFIECITATNVSNVH